MPDADSETESTALTLYDQQVLAPTPRRGFLGRIVDAFRPQRRDYGPETQKLLRTMIPAFWQLFGEDLLTGQTAEEQCIAFEREAYLYSCVDAIASDVASMPAKFTLDGEAIERPWPEELAIFESANPHESFSDVIYSLVVDRKITGECFALWEGDVLWWLPSWQTWAVPDQKRMVSGYKMEVNGVEVDFPADAVVSSRRHGPRNVVDGLSICVPLKDQIRLLAYQRAYEIGLTKNNAAPAGYLQSTNVLSPAAKKEALKEWKLGYGGAKNAGKMAILDAAMSYKQVALSPKDAGTAAADARALATIKRVTGVPGCRLGEDQANYATSQNQMFMYWTSTVLNESLKLADAINRVIFAKTPRIKFSFDSSQVYYLQEQKRQVYAVAVAASGRPVLSVNEARIELLSKQPTDEPGADKVMLAPALSPFALGPSTETETPQLTETSGLDVQKTALNGAQVEALMGIVQAVVAGQLPRASAVAMIAAAFPLTTEQAEQIVGEAGKSFEPTPPPETPALSFSAAESRALRVERVKAGGRSAMVARNFAAVQRETNECKRKVAQPVLAAMRDAYLAALKSWDSKRSELFRANGGAPPVLRAIHVPQSVVVATGCKAIQFRAGDEEVDLPDASTFHPLLFKLHEAWFRSAYKQVVDDEVKALEKQKRSLRTARGLADRVARDVDPLSPMDPRILDALAGRQVQIVTVPESIEGMVRTLLAAELDKGSTVAEMDKALTTYFTDLNDWEATRIAVTESGSACSQAGWTAMGEVGTSMKSWFQSSFGPGVRESHTECMDEGSIPFNQPHINGMMYPHDPDFDDDGSETINCMCTELAEDFEDASEAE